MRICFINGQYKFPQWGELPHWLTFGKRIYWFYWGLIQRTWMDLKLAIGIDCRDISIKNMPIRLRKERILDFWNWYFKHRYPNRYSFKLVLR